MSRVAGIENIYPLSPMQQGMLFHSLDSADAEIYFEQCQCQLRGHLDAGAFRRSWELLVARHGILRTAFAWKQATEPLQVVHARVRLPWQEHDWRGLERQEQDDRLAALLADDRRRGFDLARAPLTRVMLIRLADDLWMLVWSFHHILLDGWSIQRLTTELMTAYGEFSRRLLPSLAPVRPYADYIAWLGRQDMAAAEAFWRRTLGDLTTPTQFPLINTAVGTDSPERLFARGCLDPGDMRALEAAARQHQLTQNTFAQGAWALLLHHYTGRRDVVFAATVAGRPVGLEGADTMIGLFINTLPLRVTIRPDQPLLEWLRMLQAQAIEARQYDYAPLAHIQRCSGVPAGAPLFDTVLLGENLWKGGTREGSGAIEIGQVRFVEHANYPLCGYTTFGDVLGLDLLSSGGRIPLPVLSRTRDRWQALLVSFARNPQQCVGDISLLTAAERREVVEAWNQTAARNASECCVHELFELQAARTPDAVALVADGEAVTYAALDRRANQLAHYLQGAGVAGDVCVAVCLERSVELVVGVLGILKAGGAYVPLDPGYPGERLAYLVENARAALVVTTESLAQRLPIDALVTVSIDADAAAIAGCPEAAPAPRATPRNLAYVIYTSGSTGRPKGVLVEHRSVSNLAEAQRRLFGITPADGVVQFSSMSFDASVSEWAIALTSGAALHLPPSALRLPDDSLVEWLRRCQSTCLTAPPTVWEALPGVWPALHIVISAGEACPAALVARLREGRRFFNAYGPTEAAVCATINDVRAGETAPSIGRPIDNVCVYVLDASGDPAPLGVLGELYVGGVGVARGYKGQPALTAARFVPDPFGSPPGGRLYQTGDRARWRSDGELDFTGRLDAQVKLRGYRIEIGEIEHCLRAHPAVADAAVVARSDRGHEQLVGYWVPRSVADTTPPDLQPWLRSRLPEYMVPASLVRLERLPLSPHGKLDRQALPEPSPRAAGAQPLAPRSESEAVLGRIWADVLGLDQVGVEDNFFELGGDSIQTIQVVSRAREAGLTITTRQLFEHPTVEELAAVAQPVGSPAAAAAPETAEGRVPLTPIQRAFLEEWQVSPPSHFTQSILLGLQPGVASARLAAAVRTAFGVHDSFRMRYARGEHGQWSQVLGPRQQVSYRRVDLSDLPAAVQRRALEQDAAGVQRSLDLAAGVLARTVEYRLGATLGRRLLLVSHHLAVDGVSWRILLDDISQAYGQLEWSTTANLGAAGASWAAWAARLAAVGEEVALEAAYWTALADGDVPRIPRDSSPQTAPTIATERTITVALDPDETRALLTVVPAVYHTQIDDVLLTVLAQTCGAWSRTPGIWVDLEGHGREDLFQDIDLSHTVGWFSTAYPVRLRVRAEEAPGRALRRVKEQLRQIPRHGIGYGVLRYLSRDPEVRAVMASLPVPEITFNYLGQFDSMLRQSAIFAPANEGRGPAIGPATPRRHVLAVSGMIAQGRLQLTWSYSQEVHRRATIERLAGTYIGRLRDLVAHCQQPGAGGWSPSDVPLAEVTIEELDRLVGAGTDVEDIYPLSPLQQGLLFHALEAPHGAAYLNQAACELGDVDVDAFRRAWETLVGRHATLRTAFAWSSVREPLQIVRRSVPLPWVEEDWRGMDEAEQRSRWDEWLAADLARGFDMRQAPLARLALIRLDATRWYFVWSNHHILCDGWSRQVVLRELFTLYEAYRTGTDVVLPRPRPYRAQIAWTRHVGQSARAEAFWRQELRGFTAPTAFFDSAARRLSAATDAQAVDARLVLSADLTSRLAAVARQHQVTLNTVAQAAFAWVLSRYSGSEDVVFGATVSGRSGPHAEGVVGLFINTLPVRVRIDRRQSVAQCLQRLQARQADAREHEHTPLVQVQQWSELPAGTPLFGQLLVFENYPVDHVMTAQAGAGWQVRGVRSADRTHYPVTVSVIPGPEIELVCAYREDAVSQAQAERLLAHLQVVLASMAANPDRPAGDLSLLSASERRQVLQEWNETETAPPPAACVHRLVEAQAVTRPDTVAIGGNEVVTYGTLHERAERLASRLRRLGVGPEVRVGLSASRGAGLLVGLLGILRSGGVYVPLDPTYPAERLRFIAADAGVRVLVADAADVPVVAEGVPVVRLDDPDSPPGGADGPVPDDDGRSAAYIVYTSGSTGRPKGVVVDHAGLTQTVWTAAQQWFRPGDVMAAMAGVGFDISLLELLAPLVAGAAVQVWRREQTQSPAWVAAAVRTVTVLHAVPALMQQIVAAVRTRSDPGANGACRRVLVGGEAVSGALLAEIAGAFPRASVTVLYGPTEAAIIACSAEGARRGDGGLPALGRALPNTRAYLLDANGEPAPAGVAAELYLGGAGVARGYLGQPGSSAARFVPDPFSNVPGARLYRTGDSARWRLEGELEFLGRLDGQVKLRGVRIELGEIEACLREHPGVAACAAALDEVERQPRIVAYVVPAAQEPGSSTELREHVRRYLPDAMVPALFVELQELPVTPNGKVDRAALRVPEGARGGPAASPVVPANEVERRMADVWGEVLQAPRVGVLDDFFELGGNSLSAMMLSARVEREFGREVPVGSVITARTVRALAAFVTAPSGSSVPPLHVIQPNGANRPLFCVHPGAGQVLTYYSLAAALGPDQPLVGLQDPNADCDDYPEASVEGLAARYADAVRSYQPEGPYNLFGWSFGGYIAFEMARTLKAQGAEVDLVAVLDTVAAPITREILSSTDSAVLLELLAQDAGLGGVRRQDLEGLSFEAQIERVAELARRAGLRDEQVDLQRALRRQVRIFRARIRASQAYFPAPYAGAITVFRAAGNPDLPADVAGDYGWGPLAARVNMEVITGRHATLMQAPHVQALAGRLRELLAGSADRAPAAPITL